ncbi:S-layer homology domain-containing protein [Marinicrinis lubricantis]|uniref:S-layer homology domain-containing protein n=1 Tax=Marinicrinis lubricantis TaxID=2086470 RepID=A0ABW1IQF3_9BACL
MVKKFPMILSAIGVTYILYFSACAADADGTEVQSFADIPEQHWAAPAIEWAVKEGVVSGYMDGTFKATQAITRAEFITMLVEGAMIPHSEGSVPWYQSYVYAAIESKLHFEADFDSYSEPITRFEMIRLALRAMDRELRTEKSLDRNAWLLLGVEKGLLRGRNYSGELEPGSLSTRAEGVALIQRLAQIRAGLKLEPDAAALENLQSMNENILGE